MDALYISGDRDLRRSDTVDVIVLAE